ncbi:hypothetical protein BK129_20330 [Paenibacillus amylolyticus]|uniref:PTS transporter subunit EIIB n=1 Tax=Paenibacillus amylolyticus TaxID=1451 RepID=UPI00096D3918|nr:hypothetical protein BK129_20330 [Paenibacillus amylolyticus]
MVGKRDNIARLTHRATRLRFELHDISQSKDRETQSSSRRHYCCEQCWDSSIIRSICDYSCLNERTK